MSSFFSSHTVEIQYMLIYILLASSVQLVMRAGVFSLASLGFWSLGAYTAANLVQRDWPTILILLLVLLGAGALGLVMARPLARLSGLYLAMATVAFDLVIPVLAITFDTYTGGAAGLFGIPVRLKTPHLVILAVLLCAALSFLERGRLGRQLTCMPIDDELARSLGIRVARHRALLFALSASIGGLAGAANAMTFRTVSPASGGFELVTLALGMAIIGGLGSWRGAVIGAALLTWLPEWLRFIGEWRNLVYGLVLVVVIMFAPDGLLGLARGAAARVRRLRKRAVA